jgi:hypothetical protein
MSIGGVCDLAQVSPAGYYRFLTTPAVGDKDIDPRSARLINRGITETVLLQSLDLRLRT